MSIPFSKTITGTIKDDTGEPLIGANVLVPGTQNGTVTDFDGNFSIQLSNSNSKTLVISYIGYKTEEIALTGMNQTINVTLMEDSNA